MAAPPKKAPRATAAVGAWRPAAAVEVALPVRVAASEVREVAERDEAVAEEAAEEMDDATDEAAEETEEAAEEAAEE